MVEYQRPAATKTVVEREADGRERVATARCKDERTGQWALEVRHPSGEKWDRSFHGSPGEVTVALGVMLDQYRGQFLRDRDRGDRPQQSNYDNNRSINVAVAPIVPTGRT